MSSETVTTVPRCRRRAPPAPAARNRGGLGLLAVAAIAAGVAPLAGCDHNEPHDRLRGSAAGGVALIGITAELDGATAEAIEREIVAPIERAVEPRPGVRAVRSTARDGRGVVIAEIARGRDLDAVTASLQAAVNGIRSILPAALPPPRIALGDPDAAPVMWLAASAPLPAVQLSDLVREAIVPRLLRVTGVRDVELRGEATRAVIVRLDPTRLDALGVTVGDAVAALGRITGRRGGGATAAAPGELAVVGGVELAQHGGASVRVRDVATIEDGVASPPGPTGGPVMLGVQVQPGVDPDPVIAAIRSAVRELPAALPAGCALAEAAAPASAAPSSGPWRPFALSITVRGPDWATLERLADQLEGELRADRDLISAVSSDHRAGATVQDITPDLDRAASLGITPTEISTALRALTVGPGKLRVGARGVPIVLRLGAQASEPADMVDRVRGVRVRTAHGELVPLAAVASVTTRRSVVLTRRDRERAITLSVDPVTGPLNDAVRRRIASLTRDLPTGYRATVTSSPWPPP